MHVNFYRLCPSPSVPALCQSERTQRGYKLVAGSQGLTQQSTVDSKKSKRGATRDRASVGQHKHKRALTALMRSINIALMAMPDWQQYLNDSGLPLFTGTLDIHWHNGNVRRIVRQRKQITFSREARDFAQDWILSRRSIDFVTGPMQLEMSQHTVVTIDFLNGNPVGKHGCNNTKYSELKRKWYRDTVIETNNAGCRSPQTQRWCLMLSCSKSSKH